MKLKPHWDAFSHYTEAVRNKLPLQMHPFTYLAGGCVAWPLECGDIDAFYVGHPDIFKAWMSDEGFYQLGGPKYIPTVGAVVPFTMPDTNGKILQIIGTSKPMSINDLLDTFDLCNCMYAFPITAASTHPTIKGAWATDVGHVRVNRSGKLHNPLRTLERYFKYVHRAKVSPDKREIDYIIDAYLQQEDQGMPLPILPDIGNQLLVQEQNNMISKELKKLTQQQGYSGSGTFETLTAELAQMTQEPLEDDPFNVASQAQKMKIPKWI